MKMWSKVDQENLKKKYSFSARCILKFYFRPCVLFKEEVMKQQKLKLCFCTQNKVAEVAAKSIWRQDYISWRNLQDHKI